MNTTHHFPRGYLATRIRNLGPMAPIGETHLRRLPIDIWNDFGLFNIAAMQGEDWTNFVQNPNYRVTGLERRNPSNVVMGPNPMQGNTDAFRHPISMAMFGNSKTVDYTIAPQYGVIRDAPNTNLWAIAHELAANIIPLMPDRIEIMDLNFEYRDPYGGVSRKEIVHCSVVLLVHRLKQFLENLLRFYSTDLTNIGHPGIQGVKLTGLMISYFRDNTIPMNERVVFGDDTIEVKNWFQYLALGKTANDRETYTRIKLWAKRNRMGFYIPTSKTNCLAECFVVNRHFAQYREQGFPKKKIVNATNKLKTQINKSLNNVRNCQFKNLNVEQTLEGYQRIINQDKRYKKNSPPTVQIYIRDFHRVYDFEWKSGEMGLYDENRIAFPQDDKIYIMLFLNHACLMIPNGYDEWKRSLADVDKEGGPKIEKPRNRVNMHYEMATFDIETLQDDVVERPFMIGFLTENGYNKYYGLDCADKFVKDLRVYVQGRRRNMIIYAHNGGRFDFYLVLKTLLNSSFHYINSIIRGTKIYRMSFFCILDSKTRVKIEFQDSFALIPQSLKTATESFKCDHVKLEVYDPGFKWSHITMENYSNYIPKLETYLKYDCRSLYDLVLKFKTWILENLHLNIYNNCSLSSISKEYFLRNYYDAEDYPIYNLGHYHYRKLHKGYMGGKCEAAGEGYHENVFPYDFNSMYPAAMLGDFPYGKPERVDFSKPFDLYDFFGFIKVKVTSIKDDRGPIDTFGPRVLPLKTQTGLWYPDMDIEQKIWLCSDELQAFSHYYYWSPLKAFQYEKTPLFANFVKDLYRLKQEASISGDAVKRQISKLLLNSGYGFWGLKAEPRTIIQMDQKTDPEHIKHKMQALIDAGWFINLIQAQNKQYWLTLTYSQSNASNVGLAAFTTARGRVILNTLILEIETYFGPDGYSGKEVQGEVWYCDTDSVYTNICLEKIPQFRHYFSESNPNALGLLMNEAGPTKYYPKALFIAPKFYAYVKDDGTEVVKLRGFPQKTYDKKTINHETKEIIFEDPVYQEDPNKESFKVGFKDLEMSYQGYVLVEKRQEMKVSLKDFFTNFDTVKVREKKINFIARNRKMKRVNGKLVSITSGDLIESGDIKKPKTLKKKKTQNQNQTQTQNNDNQ